jgi:HlyD family secretion protein
MKKTKKFNELTVRWGLAALGVLTAGCDKPEEVVTTPLSTARSPFVASAKGRVDIEGGVIRLAAQREGVIEKVLVEEGESVRAGQALAVLADEQARRNADLSRAEARQARLALAPLQARLDAARREVRRLRPLAADDTVPKQDLDTAVDQARLLETELSAARAGVAVTEQRLEVALQEIEQRTVRAPLDGKIVRRQARPGDGVSVATITPLFLFAPNAPRIVRAEVEERWIGSVASGQAAEVSLEADEKRKFNGKVLRLGYVVGGRSQSDDPNERVDSRVVECVLSIDAPGLLIGQRVIVKFKPLS